MARDRTTKGILLHRFDHSDHSAILKVLTPEDGTCSFIWKGAKKKGKGGNYGSIALPLNRLEISARFKGEEDALHLLKEVRIRSPFQRMLQEPERSSIALFLSEFLYRTTPFQAPDPSYFEELEMFIGLLDSMEDPRDLHLHLIARSMLHQGIAPEEGDTGSHFDLLMGTFQKSRPQHEHYFGPEGARIFAEMLKKGPGEKERFLKGRKERQEFLRKLIEHYRLHLGEFGKIRSLEVLQELFSEEST